MACSLVFSQSRVDFLDAFDESESSVPGTISMLFSILSACLCAFLGRERVYDNEIGLLFLLFLSLFYSDVFGERQTRSSSLFFLSSIKKSTRAVFHKNSFVKPKKKRENLIMTSAIYGRSSSASQRKTHTFQL